MNDTDFAPEKGAFFGFTEMCWHGGRLTGRIVAMALLALAATAMLPADDARAQSVAISQPEGAAELLEASSPTNGGSSTFVVQMRGINLTGNTDFMGVRMSIDDVGQAIPNNINDATHNRDGSATCTADTLTDPVVPGTETGCVRSFNTADFTISLPEVSPGNQNPSFFTSTGAATPREFVLITPKSRFDGNGNRDITITVTARDVGRLGMARVFSIATAQGREGGINPGLAGAPGFPRTPVVTDLSGTASFEIISDDGATVTLAGGDGCTNNACNIVENGGTATFTLTFAKARAGDNTILNLAFAPSTSTAADYEFRASGGSTLNTNDPAALSYPLTDSDIDSAGNALIIFTIETTAGADANDTLMVSTGTATAMTIGDALTFTVVTDPTSVTVVSDMTSVVEGDPAFNITVALNTAVRTGTVTLPYAFSGADNPGDFTYTVGGTTTTGLTGNLVFAEGDLDIDILVTALADSSAETNGEILKFKLAFANSPYNGVVVEATDEVDITINDTPPMGVASIAVNSATIREDEGEAIITVSLSNPAVAHISGTDFTGNITVDLDFTGGTSADPSVEGADFEDDYGAECVDTGCSVSVANSRVSLVYSPGEQMKTIRITGVDDSETMMDDEGPEAFTATLSNPDVAIEGGIVALPSPAFVTVTIIELTTEAEVVKNEVETVTTLIGAEQVGSISGLIRARFTSPASVVASAPSTPDTATALHLPGNPQGLGDILNGLGLEHTADADGGGVYAVWARGTYTSMEGDPMVNGMKVDYDGDSTGLGVGVEKVTGRYIAGVALNWLTTDLDLKSEDNEGLSKYEESLLMVAPYLALRRDNGRSFWISAGYGIGEADGTTAEDAITASADVSVTFLNTGADFVLTTHRNGELIGSLSALAVRKTVDSFTFAGTDTITATTLNTFRGQGEVTYYRTVEVGEGRVVKPYVGLATLHDAGDKLNDDSHALDLRGGGEFQGDRITASLEISTELLREDHKSWTISGSARYLCSPGGLGASLTLDGSHAADSDMGLEGGYGMMVREVHKDALLTPFAGMRHGSGGGEFSSGMRLAIGSDMDADLRAARRFSDDEDTLKLNFRRTF